MPAMDFCNAYEMDPYDRTGLSEFDIRVDCPNPPLCADFSDMDNFFARSDVKEALGVGNRSWQNCNQVRDEVEVRLDC